MKLFYQTMTLALTAGLTACVGLALQPQTAYASTPIYPTQPLYFHYFAIDIPKDIDIDDSNVVTSFWGNKFRAYPIASQEAFTKLVNDRINVFKNHKLSQQALDYEKMRRNNMRYADDKVKADYPDPHMTTALYEAIKYDDQHYEIYSNPENNLDASFIMDFYNQIYMYVPDQHKYIKTDQTRIPITQVLSRDSRIVGKAFFDKIRPLSPAIIQQYPNTITVGPIAWLAPDSHPYIHYMLKSKTVPMDIEIETEGAAQTRTSTIDHRQDTQISQLKATSDNKAKSITSGSRTAGGIKGQERCYRVPTDSYGSDPYVWCSWGTDGQKDNLNYPFMSIRMIYRTDGSDSQTKQAMSAWEQLMGSMKREGRSPFSQDKL